MRTAADVRDRLWDQLPEARPFIMGLERQAEDETPGDRFVGLYSYLSNAFYSDVLVPALETQRDELLVRCFAFIEQLLQSDTWVVEAARLRIVDWLSSQRQWSDTVNRHAGPTLRQELARPQPESTD